MSLTSLLWEPVGDPSCCTTLHAIPLGLHNGTMASHNAIQTRTSRWFHSVQGGPCRRLLERKNGSGDEVETQSLPAYIHCPQRTPCSKSKRANGFSWHFASFWDCPSSLLSNADSAPVIPSPPFMSNLPNVGSALHLSLSTEYVSLGRFSRILGMACRQPTTTTYCGQQNAYASLLWPLKQPCCTCMELQARNHFSSIQATRA